MNEKQVDIVFMSFYFTDVIFMVVDRLHEVTKHPFRIIVGDNLSENSPVIREKLRDYVEQGKISTAYFFDNNSRYNRLAMYKNEPKPDYYVGSDQDAFIEDNSVGCWLTDAIEMLESDKNVGITGMSSLNGPATTPKQILHTNSLDMWKIFPPAFRRGPHMPFKGHLMTLNRKLMDKFIFYACKTDKLYSDGNIQRYIAKLGYASARYEKTSVYNLGTIKLGYKIEGIDISVDVGYKKLRMNYRNVKNPAAGFEIIK